MAQRSMKESLACLALGTAAALAALLPLGAAAQASARPLSIIVPQPAGNPTDGVARKLQPLLQTQLQRTVKYKAQDMRAVALVARLPYILTGSPGLPARSLGELTAYAQARGGKGLNFGHIGPGSMIHLLGEQWARQSGLSVSHVVYRGVLPVTQDLMSGQIDLSFLPLGGATLQMIASGKVRAFATTGATPSPALPQVPALVASDRKLADFVYGTWIAFLVPARTPEATVTQLNKAIVAAMQDGSFREYVAATGMELANANSLPDMARFYGTETALYEGLARKIGVEPD